MNHMIAILLLAIAFTAEADSWSPDPRFQLEDADYLETLTWVSGVSYALTASKDRLAAQGKEFFLCNPPGIIGSRELFDILNTAHQGATITSEQAISTIILRLEARYPCS